MKFLKACVRRLIGSGSSNTGGVGWLCVAGLLGLSATRCIAQETNWTPAYTDEQQDIMNRPLERWRVDDHYPKVNDIFKNRSFRNRDESGNISWDSVPDSFKDERTARKAGGKLDYVKSPTEKTCFLKLAEDQGAWIFVYDRDVTGKYIKTGVITPPTWLQEASVTFVDALGPGRPKFILIEHLGDEGTGILERIHWLLGWHNGAFHTVFRETVYYSANVPSTETEYRLKYKFVKGLTPHIEMHSALDRVDVAAEPYDFHAQWSDCLFWDEKSFSFYNERAESAKATPFFWSDFPFRQTIETNRVNILHLPPLPARMLDYDEVEKYWQRIPLM